MFIRIFSIESLISKWTSRKKQSTLGPVVILRRVTSYVGWAKLTSFFLIYTHRNVFVLRIYFAILVQYYFTDIRAHLEGECCAPLQNSSRAQFSDALSGKTNSFFLSVCLSTRLSVCQLAVCQESQTGWTPDSFSASTSASLSFSVCLSCINARAHAHFAPNGIKSNLSLSST